MKRNNKHLNHRKSLWDQMEWPYPENGIGFFHKTHSDSPDNGLRLMENKIHKYEKKRKRLKEKKVIRDLMHTLTFDNLI